MTQTTISDFATVADKLDELGCNFPSGIAILPVNFESASTVKELRQASEAATVKTLFRTANVPYGDIVGRNERLPYIQNNAFEWIAPTLFISAALLAENPAGISVALSVIANYATDFFKGMTGDKNIKLDVVVEKSNSKTCKKVSYEGPPDGLKDLASIIEATSND